MDTIINSSSKNSFNISSFIEEHLRSSSHSWSIGIPGAIGEFMYDDDEAIDINNDGNRLIVQTPRGAMLVDLASDIKCIAYEEMSSCTRSWSQNVAFCIPEERAKLGRNNVLTYLGLDKDAVTEDSRNKHLFDLGVDSAYLQFCVRSREESLVNILKENCGRSIFEAGNPAAGAVLEHSPARIVVSSLGRVEIETTIPTTSSQTDTGPHTHLLPALLNANRKSAFELPSGYVEVLSLYPEHPAFDKYGEPRTFNMPAFDNFQNLLSVLGHKDYVQEKNSISSQLSATDDNIETSSDRSSAYLQAQRILKIQAPFLNDL